MRYLLRIISWCASLGNDIQWGRVFAKLENGGFTQAYLFGGALNHCPIPACSAAYLRLLLATHDPDWDSGLLKWFCAANIGFDLIVFPNIAKGFAAPHLLYN